MPLFLFPPVRPPAVVFPVITPCFFSGGGDGGGKGGNSGGGGGSASLSRLPLFVVLQLQTTEREYLFSFLYRRLHFERVFFFAFLLLLVAGVFVACAVYYHRKNHAKDIS